MKTALYSATGAKKPDVTLDAAVFGQTPNHELIATAYQNYLANNRTNNAQTKTRGKIAGGGRKPYRQKGTGRARTGSIRNPLWRGGGTTFGPTGIENYSRGLPKKMGRLAVAQALSAKSSDKNVIIIEDFAPSEARVKPTLQLLDKLEAEGRIVIVVEAKNEMILKATRNIAGVEVVDASNLNVYTIMNADKLIITQPALIQLKGRVNVKSAKKSEKATVGASA